jgi:hypothetical protein
VNKDLEALILAYEDVSAARDEEAEKRMEIFESLIDRAIGGHPGVSREAFRKGIITRHRQWAMKQQSKPPTIPPKA